MCVSNSLVLPTHQANVLFMSPAAPGRMQMSIPDKARKHSDKAIIETARVNQERKKFGLQPSCRVTIPGFWS